MTVHVEYSSARSNATARSSTWLCKVAREITWRDYVRGAGARPDYWVERDPWARACYCPECWAASMTPEKTEKEATP